MSECGHGAVGEEGKGATSLRHRRKERDVLGAFKYDVHIILGIFDPLSLFVRKIYTVVCKLSAFLDLPTPFSVDVIYGEPLIAACDDDDKENLPSVDHFFRQTSIEAHNVLFGSFLSNLEIMCDEYVKLFRRVFA